MIEKGGRADVDGVHCADCVRTDGGTSSARSRIGRQRRPQSQEEPVKGILLNAVLIALAGIVLLTVTPSAPRAHLETVLTNIRRIRESDPTFERASEVLSLYDAAAAVAGVQRPEVDRLREEYFRQFRNNVRE